MKIILSVLLLGIFSKAHAEEIQDQPLHPDPDLVANILGSRPDASSSTLADSLSPITTPKAPGQTKPLLPSSCGGEVIAKVNEVDTLLSPGFPHSYPSDLHCVWTLKAPPGYRVVGQFTEFDLTESEDCSSDYVQISGLSSHGTSDNREEPRHCGKSTPRDFSGAAYSVSSNAALRIVFHTNRDDSCKGFAFQYRVETNHVTCGDVSEGYEFEFTNAEYPNAILNATQHCSVQVSHDCETPICQLRLDLMDFELMSPVAGNCETDQFIIRANEPLPILCGRNSGQHLYVDVRGRKTTDLSIITDVLKSKPVGVLDTTTDTLTTEWRSELDRPRKWRIRVTQIPCDCKDNEDPRMELAPAGCLQYYDSVNGKIQSFNFEGMIRNLEPCYNGTEPECGQELFTGHLNNLDYAICIKDHLGYCGISYSALNLDDFQMSGVVDPSTINDLNEIQPTFGESKCYDDYVFIPRGHHPEDLQKKFTTERYCGHRFGNRLPGPVISHARPFLFKVSTDATEPFSGVALSNRGFSLDFQQLPCSLSTADAISFA